MARRLTQPFIEFKLNSNRIEAKASSNYVGFVAKLNLKKIKDDIRKRTNRFFILIVKAIKKHVGSLVLKLSRFLGRCLRRAIETIATFIFISLCVSLAFPIFKWFISTPIASQFGITLTSEQILLIIDKFIDFVL